MSQIKERAKSIICLLAAVFFFVLCSFMFFPWFDWEEQENINGTIIRLTTSQSSYGSTPYYVVTLESGKMIRVKAPVFSDFKSGDEIELRLFTDKRNQNLRRYAVKMSDVK